MKTIRLTEVVPRWVQETGGDAQRIGGALAAVIKDCAEPTQKDVWAVDALGAHIANVGITQDDLVRYLRNSDDRLLFSYEPHVTASSVMLNRAWLARALREARKPLPVFLDDEEPETLEQRNERIREQVRLRKERGERRPVASVAEEFQITREQIQNIVRAGEKAGSMSLDAAMNRLGKKKK